MKSIDTLRDVRVREMIADLASPGARILELSCGKAGLLTQLHNDGYAVRGTNFTAYPDTPVQIEIDNGVDVLQGLPYEDGSFDIVLFLDVIEHLHDHETALHHAARVLRKGGHLIIVSPNICNLSSRLHFLMTGFFKIRRSFIGFDLPVEKSFAFHNHPPHLPVFLYQMQAQGVGLSRFDAVGIKLKSVISWALLFPWVWLFTRTRATKREKHLAGTQAGDLLFRTLTSFRCLTGEAMILIGQRSEQSTQICDVTARETPMPDWYHGGSARVTSGELPANETKWQVV